MLCCFGKIPTFSIKPLGGAVHQAVINEKAAKKQTVTKKNCFLYALILIYLSTLRYTTFPSQFSVEKMWPKHHPNHTGDDKQHPENDSKELHTKQRLLTLLYDFLLSYQA